MSGHKQIVIDKWRDDQELGSGKLTFIAFPSQITCLLYPNFAVFVASSLAALASALRGVIFIFVMDSAHCSNTFSSRYKFYFVEIEIFLMKVM